MTEVRLSEQLTISKLKSLTQNKELCVLTLKCKASNELTLHRFRFIKCWRKLVNMEMTYLFVDKKADLRPGSNPPVCRAGHSVAGTSGLGFLSTAILAVDGAICALMQELNTAHGADLVTQVSACFGAVLPFLSYPPLKNKQKNNVCKNILAFHNS